MPRALIALFASLSIFANSVAFFTGGNDNGSAGNINGTTIVITLFVSDIEYGWDVKTYDDVLIEYGRAEKPRVTVEHYEPNIWLRLFTFCQAEDYYYITLPDHNYLSMGFD